MQSLFHWRSPMAHLIDTMAYTGQTPFSNPLTK